MNAPSALGPSPAFGRWVFVSLAVVVALVVIVALTALLEQGSGAATLLLDYQMPDLQTFPYPFTMQNVMILLFAAGIGDALHRNAAASREAVAIRLGLLPEDDHSVILRRELGSLRERIQHARGMAPSFLCDLADECAVYFHTNQDAGQAQSMMSSMVDLELHRVDLRFTLLRYVCWAIPTVGFIGTVVGIAQALNNLMGKGAMAEGAAQNMDLVIATLAIAFNTTILALILSFFLVLATQFAQQREEEAINASASYCLRNLINRLYVDKKAS